MTEIIDYSVQLPNSLFTSTIELPYTVSIYACPSEPMPTEEQQTWSGSSSIPFVNTNLILSRLLNLIKALSISTKQELSENYSWLGDLSKKQKQTLLQTLFYLFSGSSFSE